MRIIVTGGAGFIGSALVRRLVQNPEGQSTGHEVCVLDKLTYSGSLENLAEIRRHTNHCFYQADICDRSEVAAIFDDFKPDAIMNLAAESHVDRSIDGPGAFIETNILGTFNLLEVARHYYKNAPALKFLHVSTDEVFGSLGEPALFREDSPYQPNSPYSASKAASDHLVRAWGETYNLPVLITNCSNNYGPYQFPEKLIPLTILRACAGKTVPVYGDGQQVRDWLYVEDHVDGLCAVLERGQAGRTYNIGGRNEMTNLAVVQLILEQLALARGEPADALQKLIEFVADRPGHDRRYAIDVSRITRELNWAPSTTFAVGIRKTIAWYLANAEWCTTVSQVDTDTRIGLAQNS